jgi:hypothetical protein
MYQFTNGIIVYDEKTKDKFLKSGFKLKKMKKEKQITIDEVIDEESNKSISTKSTRVSKKTSKNRE